MFFMIERDRKSIEIRNRIRIAVYAYTYEYLDISLIDDFTFDQLARQIDLSIDTGRPALDTWFRENYDASTGMWVRRHPELNKIIAIFWGHYASNYATRRVR